MLIYEFVINNFIDFKGLWEIYKLLYFYKDLDFVDRGLVNWF